jgi:hypothetical protein
MLSVRPFTVYDVGANVTMWSKLDHVAQNKWSTSYSE